ncbi:MAG: hypothetical protein M3R17_10320 [Bacteroidota bacterium]|nr:hypothetical protein [Bacteroidota bacterium]
MRGIAICFVLIVVFIISCNVDGEKVSKDSVAACKTNSINPNGDSELAILMREFAAYSDSVKQDLLNNRTPRPQPENLSHILSAKKTDQNIDKEVYDPLARAYIANVEYFYTSKPEDRVENYNSMISTCISCHQSFCGGPIKRIQKLYIPVK